MRFIFLIFTLLSLSGCSTTLYSVVPNAIVEPPDIAEIGSKELIIRSDGAKKVDLVGDAADRPLNVSNPPDLEPSTEISAGLNFVVFKKLQLGLAFTPHSLWPNDFAAMARGMAKYQIFSSENGDHTFSIFGHLIGVRSDMKGNQMETFGPGGYPWHASTTAWGLNGGASYGYRFGEKYLSYIGSAYETFGISANVTQDASATGDYPAASANLPYSQGFSRTLNLGLIYGKTQRLTLNYSIGDTRWNGMSNSVHFLSVGYSGIFESNTKE